MKRYTLILILICINSFINSYAQDSLFFDHKHRIKIYPTQFIVNEIALGYEYNISNNKAIELSFGYSLDQIFINDNFYIKNHLSEYDKKLAFKLNYKLILDKCSSPKKRVFISSAIYYSYSMYDTKEVKYSYGFSNFTVNQSEIRKRSGIDFIFGKEYEFLKRVVFEYFIGIGISYNKYIIVIYNSENILDAGPYPYTERQSKFLPSAQLGIKISLPLIIK
ncbi:MAG: hypothetical protein FVQ77_01970 [Cytophagales bacterium]|nr:hypothetical protein [Cytophagales bacterium]